MNHVDVLHCAALSYGNSTDGADNRLPARRHSVINYVGNRPVHTGRAISANDQNNCRPGVGSQVSTASMAIRGSKRKADMKMKVDGILQYSDLRELLFKTKKHHSSFSIKINNPNSNSLKRDTSILCETDFKEQVENKEDEVRNVSFSGMGSVENRKKLSEIIGIIRNNQEPRFADAARMAITCFTNVILSLILEYATLKNRVDFIKYFFINYIETKTKKTSQLIGNQPVAQRKTTFIQTQLSYRVEHPEISDYQADILKVALYWRNYNVCDVIYPSDNSNGADSDKLPLVHYPDEKYQIFRTVHKIMCREKGNVANIAEKAGVTKHTIYSHLANLGMTASYYRRITCCRVDKILNYSGRL